MLLKIGVINSLKSIFITLSCFLKRKLSEINDFPEDEGSVTLDLIKKVK